MKALILVAALPLLLSRGAHARTWQIFVDGSGDAPTVQAGIDSAAVGDTVLVGPGSYSENISFLGKDIVVMSEQGPLMTQLEGDMALANYTVAFRSNETRQAMIAGFTITGNRLGISVRDAEPTIQANIVEGNQGGGGIGCSTSMGTVRSPLIRQNIIRANTSDPIGGGIWVVNAVAPEIVENTIEGNTATFGDGGGIYLRASAPGAVITHNLIIGNHADDMGGGIFASWGLPVGGSNYEIAWNVIQGNSSNSVAAAGIRSGGGIYLGSTGAWVHHNTIVENRGYCTAPEGGGGITLCGEINPLIEQNIVAFNNVGDGIVCLENSTAQFRNNLVWGNEPNDLDAACAALWGDNGNLTADPDFCDRAAGDFSLGKNSPAITHPAGPLGAIAEPGCEGTVPTRHTTWGWLKSHFKNP